MAAMANFWIVPLVSTPVAGKLVMLLPLNVGNDHNQFVLGVRDEQQAASPVRC